MKPSQTTVGWARRPLRELCSVVRGITFSAADASPAPFDGGIACLTTSGVQVEPDWGACRYVRRDLVSAVQVLRAGDILVSTANSRALVGKCCLVEQPPFDCTFGAFVTVLRPNSRIEAALLMLWLRSPGTVAEMQRLASNTTNIANLKVSDLLALEMPVPSAEEQGRMKVTLQEALRLAGGALSAVDGALSAARALTPSMLRIAFKELTPIHAGGAPPPAPAGWGWRTLTQVARLESGHTPSRRHPEWWGGEVPWIALPDIRALDGKLAYATAENTNELGIANSSARVLPAHTVVMSRTASVGFVTVMGRPMATSQDFVNWVCGREMDPFFLAYALRASRDYIRGLASGAVHKTIYMPMLHSLHVCMPRIEEQRRIVAELDARLAGADRLCSALAARREQVEKLPSVILRSAFTPASSALDVLPELLHA